MDEEHLPAAIELTEDRVADEPGRRLGDPGLDRQAVLRRRLDHRHITDAGQGEVERPRDRRRGQREDVDLAAELLELLLRRDAEALLLVDDDEPEVLERDVLREEPVGADDEVDRAVGEAVDGPLLLRGADEPREEPDLDREGRESLRERLMVLGGEDRRRDEDRDLAAVLDRLERGPQCDLGLAVADVADDEAVHGPADLHVRLDLDGRPELVRRLLVGERRLHLGLPGRVPAERVAGGPAAGRVELEELVGEIRHRLPDTLLRPQPLGPTELRELRPLGTAVARDPGDLLDRDEDLVAGGEAQLEVVAILALAFVAAAQHPLVAGDAVVDVDDEVARRKALEDVARHDPPHRLGPPDADGPEQLAVGDEGEAVGATLEAAVQAPFDDRDRAGRRRLRSVDDGRRMARLLEQLGEARRLVGGEDDPRAVGLPTLHGLGDRRGAAGGQLRLAPAELVAGAQAARRERALLWRLRLPGELERPARDEARLPGSRPDVRRGPVLRQLAGLDELPAALVRLAPEEVGRLSDVAWLVDHEERFGRDVVEAAGRGEERRPDFRRIAHVQGPQFLAAAEPLEVGRHPLRQLRRLLAELVPEPTRPAQELRGGQQRDQLDRADGALVRGVEGPEGVDLVAEELDPDRQRRRGREHVDDPAATSELAPAGDLGGRGIAELEQIAEELVLAEPGVHCELAGCRRQIVRGDRVLDERLDAGDEDPRPPAPPRGQGRDPGRRFVGDELAPLVREGGPRLEDRDAVRVAQPRRKLLGHAVADLRVAGDPGNALAALGERERRGEVRLGAMRHGADARVPSRRGEALAERLERTGRREERRQGAEIRQSAPGAATRRRGRPAAGSLAPVAIAAAPSAEAGSGRCRHGSSFLERTRRQPVRVRRIPSASGGPSTAPGGASRSVSAGRSSNMLKRFAALDVPWRAHSSTASAPASSNSSRRCRSSGWNGART